MKVDEILPGDYSWDKEFIFELPIEFGGNLDSKELKKAKDGLMLFDIKTGAKEAQKLYEKEQDKLALERGAEFIKKHAEKEALQKEEVMKKKDEEMKQKEEEKHKEEIA